MKKIILISLLLVGVAHAKMGACEYSCVTGPDGRLYCSNPCM